MALLLLSVTGIDSVLGMQRDASCLLFQLKNGFTNHIEEQCPQGKVEGSLRHGWVL
jgi:hypothetical protein